MRIFVAVLTVLWALGTAHAETIRMAVTTSFHNSGLSESLLPALESDTGIDLQLLVVGTGQALKLGEAGDVDAVLVHSKAKEEAFVTAGFGTHRREIMFNDFVLVGPANLEEKFAQAPSIESAMQLIAQEGATFISRGDDSGTHGRERALWKLAGIAPTAPWYREAGAGMGATLNVASGMGGAITLSDRATWLKFANKGNMKILYQRDENLANQYAFLPVNPKRHPHVKAQTVAQLEDWLTGKGQALIDAYRIDGQQVFFANAKAKAKP